MVVNTKIFKDKGVKTFYYSISFLVFSLLLTIGLFLYNNYIKKENLKKEAEIVSIKNKIKSLEDNKEIKIYEIYNNNKTAFDLISYKSQIPKFMEHLKKVYYNTNLIFNGFNYSNGKVSIRVVSSGDKQEVRYRDENPSSRHKKPDYMKIIGFLNWYKGYKDDIFKKTRFKDIAKDGIFEIEKINRFIGGDEIKFNIVFKLK